MSKDDELFPSNIRDLFTEFGVKNETELEEKLNAESTTIPCCKCKQETPIGDLRFPRGEPLCVICIQKIMEKYT